MILQEAAEDGQRAGYSPSGGSFPPWPEALVCNSRHELAVYALGLSEISCPAGSSGGQRLRQMLGTGIMVKFMRVTYSAASFATTGTIVILERADDLVGGICSGEGSCEGRGLRRHCPMRIELHCPKSPAAVGEASGGVEGCSARGMGRV